MNGIHSVQEEQHSVSSAQQRLMNPTNLLEKDTPPQSFPGPLLSVRHERAGRAAALAFTMPTATAPAFRLAVAAAAAE